MKTLSTAVTLLAAGLLMAAPALAQQAPDKAQRTQDGNPGGAGYKQKVQDGNSPTTDGPGSQAYKQKTQSLSHSADALREAWGGAVL